jgi:hypothetical protein
VCHKHLESAEHLFTRAWQIRARKLGPDAEATMDSVEKLALVLLAQGRNAQAESVLRRAITPEYRDDGEPGTAQEDNDNNQSST